MSYADRARRPSRPTTALVLTALLAGTLVSATLVSVTPAAAQDGQRDDDDSGALANPASAHAGVPPRTRAHVAPPPPPGSGYCARQLGTWFYCEDPAPPPVAPSKASPSDEPQVERPPEIVELEAYQKALDESRQIAAWRPTPENVERYIRLQRVAIDKSGTFSDMWRRAVWTHPDLDYTLERPTTQIAKAEFDNERASDRDLFLRAIAPEVGMFYVYSGTCGPCRVASPIIKSFADRYGVNVRVIATDGASNPVFGRTLADHGQLRAWGIDHEVTPALLIFQSPTRVDREGAPRPLTVAAGEGRTLQLRPCTQERGCLTYLGAGVMSVEDIAERAFVLLSKEPGTDY